jgi:hypothetical protein
MANVQGFKYSMAGVGIGLLAGNAGDVSPGLTMTQRRSSVHVIATPEILLSRQFPRVVSNRLRKGSPHIREHLQAIYSSPCAW